MQKFRKPNLFERILVVVAIVVLFVGVAYILQIYQHDIIIEGGGSNFWVVLSLFFSLGTLFLMFILSGTMVDVKEELADILRKHMNETKLLKEITNEQLQEIKLLNNSVRKQGEEARLLWEQVKQQIKEGKLLKREISKQKKTKHTR